MDATWISACVTSAWIGAFAALFAAFGTVGTLALALRSLKIERERREAVEDAAFERDRWQQAEGVSAWPIADDDIQTRIAIRNQSDEPVYRAVVALVLASVTSQQGPTNLFRAGAPFVALSLIPPGLSYVSLSSVPRGREKRPGVEIAFTDRAQRHFIRYADGGIGIREQAAAQTYELDSPQWDFPDYDR